MATWPFIMNTIPRVNWLKAFILCMLVTQALAGEFNLAIRMLEQVQRPASKKIYQRIFSLLDFVLTLTRQRFLRIVNGQIGFWDMVQLITACSLVQTIRIWRRQRKARRNGSGSSAGPAVDGRNRRESATALSRVDNESAKRGERHTFPSVTMTNPTAWH